MRKNMQTISGRFKPKKAGVRAPASHTTRHWRLITSELASQSNFSVPAPVMSQSLSKMLFSSYFPGQHVPLTPQYLQDQV